MAKVRIQLSLPKDSVAFIKRYAKEQGVSVSYLTDKFFEKLIAEEEENNKSKILKKTKK